MCLLNFLKKKPKTYREWLISIGRDPDQPGRRPGGGYQPPPKPPEYITKRNILS